jgi:hypothetical protein
MATPAEQGLFEIIFESKEHWAVVNLNEARYTLAESQEDAQEKSKAGDVIVHNIPYPVDHGRALHMFPVI